MYVCICMYACMFVCMHVCMYVCMYVCVCVWVCIYIHIYKVYEDLFRFACVITSLPPIPTPGSQSSLHVSTDCDYPTKKTCVAMGRPCRSPADLSYVVLASNRGCSLHCTSNSTSATKLRFASWLWVLLSHHDDPDDFS